MKLREQIYNQSVIRSFLTYPPDVIMPFMSKRAKRSAESMQ